MKRLLAIGAWVLVFAAAVYLFSPVPGFPPPPPDSLVSQEPADTETIYRRAYYTHLTRAEIMTYYTNYWRRPFIKLIVPPEDAQTAIRDQTRSSWLEELVHPLKDSLYVNGFYPTKPTEQFNFDSVHWEGKIILHYFPSSLATRFTVLLLAAVFGYWLSKEYVKF